MDILGLKRKARGFHPMGDGGGAGAAQEAALTASMKARSDFAAQQQAAVQAVLANNPKLKALADAGQLTPMFTAPPVNEHDPLPVQFGGIPVGTLSGFRAIAPGQDGLKTGFDAYDASGNSLGHTNPSSGGSAFDNFVMNAIPAIALGVMTSGASAALGAGAEGAAAGAAAAPDAAGLAAADSAAVSSEGAAPGLLDGAGSSALPDAAGTAVDSQAGLAAASPAAYSPAADSQAANVAMGQGAATPAAYSPAADSQAANVAMGQGAANPALDTPVPTDAGSGLATAKNALQTASNASKIAKVLGGLGAAGAAVAAAPAIGKALGIGGSSPATAAPTPAASDLPVYTWGQDPATGQWGYTLQHAGAGSAQIGKSAGQQQVSYNNPAGGAPVPVAAAAPAVPTTPVPAPGIAGAVPQAATAQPLLSTTPRLFAEGGDVLAGIHAASRPLPPRFVRGPGDGQSDDIPVTMSDGGPGRLADNEFVVPADAVSALGSGSSEAGARALYDMIDRIRQTAHGSTQQANPVEPHKVLPH